MNHIKITFVFLESSIDNISYDKLRNTFM